METRLNENSLYDLPDFGIDYGTHGKDFLEQQQPFGTFIAIDSLSADFDLRSMDGRESYAMTIIDDEDELLSLRTCDSSLNSSSLSTVHCNTPYVRRQFSASNVFSDSVISPLTGIATNAHFGFDDIEDNLEDNNIEYSRKRKQQCLSEQSDQSWNYLFSSEMQDNTNNKRMKR